MAAPPELAATAAVTAAIEDATAEAVREWSAEIRKAWGRAKRAGIVEGSLDDALDNETEEMRREISAYQGLQIRFGAQVLLMAQMQNFAHAEAIGADAALVDVPQVELDNAATEAKFDVSLRLRGSRVGRLLFPYTRYVTRADSRVRPRHRLLHGFVAAADWVGWGTISPPNGWNCRCVLKGVPFWRARKMSGTFPHGTEKVDAWFQAGGADFSAWGYFRESA